MPQFTSESADLLIQACHANQEAIGDLFNQCFARRFQLQAGSSGDWAAAREAWRHSGLAAVFEVDGQGVACLIPAELLPGWAVRPDDEQRSRLRGLAWEWSRQMLPADWEATQATVLCVPDLAACVEECMPVGWATTAVLTATADEDSVGSICVVWPLTNPPVVPDPADTITETATDDAPAAPAPIVPPAHQPIDVLARLRRIPVPISVRLAEKRIPVSQLLGITSGALITFSKACDDLLDLYVNNALFCRGEAVKVGEKFGLKINQLGVKHEAETKIVQG